MQRLPTVPSSEALSREKTHRPSRLTAPASPTACHRMKMWPGSLSCPVSLPLRTSTNESLVPGPERTAVPSLSRSGSQPKRPPFGERTCDPPRFQITAHKARGTFFTQRKDQFLAIRSESSQTGDVGQRNALCPCC